MVSNPSKQCSGKFNPAALQIPQIKLLKISDFQQQKNYVGLYSYLLCWEYKYRTANWRMFHYVQCNWIYWLLPIWALNMAIGLHGNGRTPWTQMVKARSNRRIWAHENSTATLRYKPVINQRKAIKVSFPKRPKQSAAKFKAKSLSG